MGSLAALYADPFGGLDLTDEERREDTWRDFAHALRWLSWTFVADEDHEGPDPEWEVGAAVSTFGRFAQRFAVVGLGEPRREWEQAEMWGVA